MIKTFEYVEGELSTSFKWQWKIGMEELFVLAIK